jgi:hypothetical protein
MNSELGRTRASRVSTGASPVEIVAKVVQNDDSFERWNVVGEGADHSARGTCAPRTGTRFKKT